MKISLILPLLAIVLLAGCTNIEPVGDTTAPKLMIQAKTSGPGMGVLIASSDTADQLNSLGCPLGTLLEGQNPNNFFIDLPRTVTLTVTSSDKGGVRYLSVLLRGGLQTHEVSNVISVNDAQDTVKINQVNANTVGLEATFTNLRTAQILTFDVAVEGEGLIVEVETADFNNHKTSLPKGRTGGTDHGGQIFDISACQ